MILPLNLEDAQVPLQKMLKARKSDIIINRSSIDCDTLVYQIPSNYKIETVPTGKNLNSNFGNYSNSISVKGNEITYIRKLEIRQGRYKPTEYKELYDFILSIAKADNVKVILAKSPALFEFLLLNSAFLNS